jgi:putative ABC transport system permease protein
MAFAVYREPNGKQQVVALIGADPNLGTRFPVPELTERPEDVSPESVIYDESDRNVLETVSLPATVEINGHRTNIDHEIRGFGGFLGVPSLFTSYHNAARVLGFSHDEGMYIVARVGKQYSVPDVQQSLRQRLPEVDVLTREEFAHKAQMYWVIKTGAGSAILTAAVLGFVIGLVVVSQTIFANTIENIDEYATLRALGASRAFVARVVMMESIICGAGGPILGLLAVIPAMRYATSLIPWIHTPWWLPMLVTGMSLLMCSLASITSVRSSLSVDPGRVFRA